LISRVPVLVVCAWLLLYAGRPLSLGFYSDDWDIYSQGPQGAAPFSLARFNHFVGIQTTQASRPAAGLIGFVINSIAGQSPFGHEVFCALFALLAALSLRAWLKSLLPEMSWGHSFAADLAAAVWLTVPWSVATTGWVTCAAAALPAQIFFTESARRMAARDGRESKQLLLSGALLLASYLSYETFYFQGILLGAFYWFHDRRGSGSRRYGVILTVCVVQTVSIAFNRFIAYFNPTKSKALASGWQSYFWESLRLLPSELLLSTASLGTAWTVLFEVLVVTAIASAVVLLFSSERRRLFGSLGVITLSLGSIPVFCAIYAVAGYRIAFTGFTSRTLAGVSWAVAVLVYGLLSVILLSRRRVIAVTGMAAALLFAVVSGMAQQLHVAELAEVWQAERVILARAPVEQIRSLPKDRQTRILYIGPAYRGNLPIFGAEWELTGAVFSLPELREWQKPDQHPVDIHPATTLYDWSWDGAELVQELPGYWKRRFVTNALYIWSYDEGRLIRAEAGYQWSPRSGSGAATSAAATFLRIDTKTQGNWEGVYGIDGSVIAGGAPNYPTYAAVALTDTSSGVWASSVTDARAPQNPTGTVAAVWWTPLLRTLWGEHRMASRWWSASSFTIDVNLTDGQTHQVAIYLLDWDSVGASAERIDALDADTGAVLDTRTISGFSKGQYLVWNLRGHVGLRVTPTADANSVTSGLFFQ
jgi:hypothetical protein